MKMNLTDILNHTDSTNKMLEQVDNRLECLLEALHGPRAQEVSPIKGSGNVTGPFYSEMEMLLRTRNTRIEAVFTKISQLEEHFVPKPRDTADASSR
jgi:hypothetical protein